MNHQRQGRDRTGQPEQRQHPGTAGRPASATHPESRTRPASVGPPATPPERGADRVHRQTPANARSALGDCSSVSTDEASWMTAKEMAAISSGPPSAEATIQRMTNQDAGGGVAAAVVRAVPHTIASTGSSGITPSSLPPIDTGT